MEIKEYLEKYKDWSVEDKPFYNKLNALYNVSKGLGNLRSHTWPEFMVDMELDTDQDEEKADRIVGDMWVILDHLDNLYGDVRGYMDRYFETLKYYENAISYVETYDARDVFIPLYKEIEKFLSENHIFDDKAARQYNFCTLLEYLLKLRQDDVIKERNPKVLKLVNDTIKDIVTSTKALDYKIIKNQEIVSWKGRRVIRFGLEDVSTSNKEQQATIKGKEQDKLC